MSDRDDEKLKPCPFCGGEAVCDTTMPNGHDYHVSCHTEGCAGDIYRPNFNYIEAGAIAAWNRRAEPEKRELEVENEKLHEILEKIGQLHESYGKVEP